MELRDIPITSLIPQRPPFVMVDRVLSCDTTDAVTEFAIREDNIFLDDMKLSAAGIIENMAQSCAARMGCINRMHNESVKIGFIGDIRDCHIIRQPPGIFFLVIAPQRHGAFSVITVIHEIVHIYGRRVVCKDHVVTPLTDDRSISSADITQKLILLVIC